MDLHLIPHWIPYAVLAICYLVMGSLIFVDASLVEHFVAESTTKIEDGKTKTRASDIASQKHAIEITDGVLYLIIALTYALLSAMSYTSSKHTEHKYK